MGFKNEKQVQQSGEYLMNWSLITTSPLFGFTLTILVLMIYLRLFQRAKSPLLSPFLFAMVTIIILLLAARIPYSDYEKGASILSFFMGPAIVALAIPMYKQFDKLKANALPILLGVTVGVLVSVTGGVLMSLLFGLSKELAISMAPKGATSAISLKLSETMGGNPAMTVTFVNISGIFIYIFGVQLLNRLKINEPLSLGIGLGTAAHVIGTKRAMELGDEEGAYASLGIGLAGVFTSLFMPFVLKLFGLLK